MAFDLQITTYKLKYSYSPCFYWVIFYNWAVKMSNTIEIYTRIKLEFYLYSHLYY